jgi:hypothetical protein
VLRRERSIALRAQRYACLLCEALYYQPWESPQLARGFQHDTKNASIPLLLPPIHCVPGSACRRSCAVAYAAGLARETGGAAAFRKGIQRRYKQMHAEHAVRPLAATKMHLPCPCDTWGVPRLAEYLKDSPQRHKGHKVLASRVGESAGMPSAWCSSCLCGESDLLAYCTGAAAGLEIVAGREDFPG